MKILCFSDIHSDLKALERLMDIEADYYLCAGDLVSWQRGLDRAGKLLARRAGRTMIIPGNHETHRSIIELCEKFGLEDLHGKTKSMGGLTVAGLGYSNPTPFDTPGEYSEEELAERLIKFEGLQPLLLACHCPPQNTPLDRGANDSHFGSTAVASFIDRYSPRYFVCGHIHESEGVRAMLGQKGETLGLNVGKRGYIIDLAAN